MNTDGHHEVTIVIADISGSTALLDRVGNDQGYHLIGECLKCLRFVLQTENGIFIRSKGDDVLGAFYDASQALNAASQMVAVQTNSMLDIHVGIHYGQIINFQEDVFGDTINLTDRLTKLAKPGEILASIDFTEQLPIDQKQLFNPLESITLKGKSSPTVIFTLVEHQDTARTIMVDPLITKQSTNSDSSNCAEVCVSCNDKTYRLSEGISLNIGRADENDIVIDKPWVSRQHALIIYRQGRIEYKDQSSTGSYVLTQDGYEFFINRDSVLLAGSGLISPAKKHDDSDAQVIRYQIQY